MDQDNRIVVLIDMDCFYCQVEEKLNPELAGKPIAVVQYNPWKGGGIIAVNYVARARGVTRHMRGDEAKEKCPDIQLPSVPCQRGKADITKYRDAGKDVAKVLQKFTPLLERASIDEAYLDITAPVEKRLSLLNVNTIASGMIPNTFALGYDSIDDFVGDIQACASDSMDFDYEHAKRLLIGAVIVSEIRAAVYEETGYRCSAGIAHNKILAKLVCGMNKPNKQTVLPKHTVNILYKTLPLKKVKHLGGKFGDSVRDVLRINTMAELQQFTEKELQTKFDEKNGVWLYNIARGVDTDPVQARFNPKSIGCCKQLRGKSALTDLDSLRKWLRDLGDEIEDRLEKDAVENNRTPRQMVVSFSTQLPNGQDTSSSRSYNFTADDDLCGELFSTKALELLMESAEGVRVKDGEENRKLKAPIKFLGISVGKFEDTTESKKTKKIKDYFNAGASNIEFSKTKDNTKENNDRKSSRNDKGNDGKEYVLQKFLQISSNAGITQNNAKPNDILKETDSNKVPPIEASLDKQESFFAKLLTSALNKDVTNLNCENSRTAIENNDNRTTTPVCNVVEVGDDSNDTDYSGSTINNEINRSIALFEEDAEDVARVSNMRQLLNGSKIADPQDNHESNNETVASKDTRKNPESHLDNGPNPETIETIECPDCKKSVSIDMLDVHADYHLALTLRNEERQQMRKEIQDKTVNVKEKTVCTGVIQNKEPSKKLQNEDLPSERTPSIASFFVKIDNSVPTEVCPECGKKVAAEKITEHLDFHEAQKLSRQLNNKATPISVPVSNSKRKRKSGSPVKKPKVPCKSIDLFFR